MTSYTDIISLEQAKNYLRIDDGMTADDQFITSMIKASLQWIEQYTNHITVAHTKTIYPSNSNGSCLPYVYVIYDYPVISITATDYTEKKYATYRKVYSDAEEIEVALGYASLDLVPEALIQAAYAILQVWYYNSERTVQSNLIPDSVKFALDPYRRFPLF